MSLYENIQALGNRMVTNLGKMGVSAEFADGGLTLADKILEINKFTSGIILSVDKPIEQSSNTINFTAHVLKEGVAQAGKKVHFKGVYTNEITISSSSSNVDLGENGWIITLTGGTAKIGTLSKLLHITKTSSGYNVGVQSAGSTTNLQGSYVYYDGSSKILYSDVAYLDLSNASGIDQVDFTNLYGADSTFGTLGGVVRLPLYATTNSYGVATATYTCEGAGELTVQAMSGSVVSQPYSITDATYYDTGISGTASDIWYNQQNAVNTRGSEYSEITENGGTAILRLKSANSIDKTNICVEFDVWQDGSTSNNFMSFVNTTVGLYSGTYSLSQLNLQTETWNHIKLEIDNNGVVTPNGITSAQKTLSINTDKMFFVFLTNGDITKIRFKDWRVYQSNRM